MSRWRPRPWWGLAAVSVLLTLFGVTDVASGLEADPAIVVALTGLTPAEILAVSPEAHRLADFFARSQGLVLLGFGLVLMAIVAVPYRRRERWAWVALWVLPGWAALVPAAYAVVGIVPNATPPPPMVSGPIVAVFVTAILLIDRRAFMAGAEAFARVPGEGLVVSGVRD